MRVLDRWRKRVPAVSESSEYERMTVALHKKLVLVHLKYRLHVRGLMTPEVEGEIDAEIRALRIPTTRELLDRARSAVYRTEASDVR